MPEPSVQALLKELRIQSDYTVRDLEDRLRRILEEYHDARSTCGPRLISSLLLDAVVAACDSAGWANWCGPSTMA